MAELPSVKTLTADAIHMDIAPDIAAGVPYLEAIVSFAEKKNMEIEAVAAIIKRSELVTRKIYDEAVSLRLVKSDQARHLF